MITPEDIGKIIRNRRKRRGLTLNDINASTGIDIGNLSKIENGKANPTLDNLLKIINTINQTKN